MYEDYKLIYLQFRTMNTVFRAMLDELESKGETKIVLLQEDFSEDGSVLSMIGAMDAHGGMPNHVVHCSALKAYSFIKINGEILIRGWKWQSSYVIVKYALLGLMKSLAIEYADRGITVSGVNPNMMERKFLSEIPEYIVEKTKKIDQLEEIYMWRR